MTELILQKVSETDIPLIRQLAYATWEPTYRDILPAEQLRFMQDEIYSEASLINQMNAGQEFHLVMYNTELIGFLSFSELVPAEKIFKLNKIYLLPEVQGKGFGKKALQKAEEIVKSKGGKKLRLNVNRNNPAKQFYRNCGYSVLKEEDIPIGKYWMNDFVMDKSLD